ncbi:MAG: hypothetical protein IJA81_04235 [Akkermansia sp.]|nr:hypothetical protein [Akkermansia sp.]
MHHDKILRSIDKTVYFDEKITAVNNIRYQGRNKKLEFVGIMLCTLSPSAQAIATM